MLASEHHVIFEPWVSTALMVALLVVGVYVWQGWGSLKRWFSRKRTGGQTAETGSVDADSVSRVDGD